MMPRWILLLIAGIASWELSASCADLPRVDGNRLTYLDSDDPFYPNLSFPKLTTPQWIGERGVEAVVILAVDDMRSTTNYETFLRPILNRLKQIDGRAPVSIFCNALDPAHPQLQSWLKEGLSLEVHTLAHPCPCLARGDFNAAVNTYHGCVDLLNRIPGNNPVAFRMPCCDSMNSPSPRFYAELFNRVSPEGKFLTIDSSVMCLLTTNDISLPRPLVLDADGREKFRKYLPTQTNALTKVSMSSFVTTLEDYPYPYVINKLCWEFPCMVPSDWEANNLQGPTNPATVADWKAALDAVVLKQGVFTFIFHPHGWIRSGQMVDFIDYAAQKYGRKVKFLNFREAQERLGKNFLADNPVRAADGLDNGVRVLDVNNDGFMDLVVGNARVRHTRLWRSASNTWFQTEFPLPLRARLPVNGKDWFIDPMFSVVQSDGAASIMMAARMVNEPKLKIHESIYEMSNFYGFGWHFKSNNWMRPMPEFLRGLDEQSKAMSTRGQDLGFRCRDLDSDGRCELIGGRPPSMFIIETWVGEELTMKPLTYRLPEGTSFVNSEGRDAGLRFVDVNGDGYDDVLFSNEERFSLHLFIPKANPRLMWKVGWNDEVFSGKRGESPVDIPMIVRGGTNRNNGVWFKNGTMWVQNEDTTSLSDKVDRRSFRQLLTADQPPPMSPEQSLAAIQVRPGFKVELAAAEPLLRDPIAFDWSADGRLWVVEMGDYPAGLTPSASLSPAEGERAGVRGPARPAGEWDGVIGRPGGRVVILEDTDGDGRYDKSTVFLDGLNFPTGIIPWRKGVIIAAAPEIFYAEDTDGDGKADVRQTLFTGFTEGNPQHRLNGFDYGLDGWIYGANGDSGGTIKRAAGVPPAVPPADETSAALSPVNIRSHDFRFRPDTGEFEAIEGQTQYGRHRDDWGNWFGNNNPTWLWHYFIPEHYLARNPHLAVKTTRQMLANYENYTRLYPASRTRQRFNDHHQFNHVTSGNSPTPYRDDLFGPDFATSAFISDPVHNLVHREVLEPDGVTFTSHRAPDEQQSEFLASADNWFRPTMLRTGPDGALYIADMYRLVIEHPEWIPKWMQQRLDLRAGSDKGRIYRVSPLGATPRKIPRLDQLDTPGLVAALDSPSGWQRDTAQRLLTDKQDKGAVEPLKRLSVEAKNPKVRVQALCALEALKSLDFQTLEAAVHDPQPAVRENGIRLSEPFRKRILGNAVTYTVKLGDTLSRIALDHGTTVKAIRSFGGLRSDQLRVGQTLFIRRNTDSVASGGTISDRLKELIDAILKLADDPQVRVRFQLAFTLGEWSDARAGEALVRIAVRDPRDSRLQAAVMSSASNHLGPMLDAALDAQAGARTSIELVEQLLTLATALEDQASLARALERVVKPEEGNFTPWHFTALACFLDTLDRRDTTLEKFAQSSGAVLGETLADMGPVFRQARSSAMDESVPDTNRIPAIRLLARGVGGHDEDMKRLGQLLRPQNRPEIQKAALSALGQGRGESVATVLLANWAGLSPTLRADALTTLFTRSIWVHSLLTAMESGQIPAGQLSLPQQQQLLKHADGSIRARAAKLYFATRSDRQALLKEYAEVEKLKGDATRGAALYKQNCATCHRLHGEGIELGPDLGTMAGKPIETLLLAILDPNQAVEARYVNYTAVTRSGREASGIITTETANNITLRAAGGVEEILLRTDLKDLTSSGLSIMPEGFEKTMKPQDMADLLAHILGVAPPK